MGGVPPRPCVHAARAYHRTYALTPLLRVHCPPQAEKRSLMNVSFGDYRATMREEARRGVGGQR